ncbi:MAG: response regulator [Pseudomonadales bacterium]|nr:response regulator [Pseudomonadales bacterium]
MKVNILFVDDEPEILSSLNRVFRSEKFKVFNAQSGEDGLKIVQQETIQLVISDMRMPGMNGAEFLGKVADQWPETIRMILTGYADIGTTIQAINEGQIDAYISKPWKKDDLLQTVNLALYGQKLELENKKLQLITKQQNENLQQMNAELELKVSQRTEKLKRSNHHLDLAVKGLRANYDTAIEVFSRMIALRDPDQAGHCKRVAQLAKNIARQMSLETSAVANIYYAGLLHDIGKMNFSASMMKTPVCDLLAEEKKIYSQHSTFGEMLLVPLDQYHAISHYIRHHHERYNGTGFPDSLKAEGIPLGAAIIAVAEDFDEACSGFLFKELLSQNEAKQMIFDGRGKKYQPDVVDAFMLALEKQTEEEQQHGKNKVTTDHLLPNMVLEKDLISAEGILLLTAETTLTATHIKKIQKIEQEHQSRFVLWIDEGSIFSK